MKQRREFVDPGHKCDVVSVHRNGIYYSPQGKSEKFNATTYKRERISKVLKYYDNLYEKWKNR